MSINELSSCPLTCAVCLASCNASNLDESMNLYAVFRLTTRRPTFRLGHPSLNLSRRCDSTLSDWASRSALFSTPSAPDSYPSLFSALRAHACIHRKLYCCLVEADCKALQSRASKTFVDRDGGAPTKNQATRRVVRGRPFKELQ
jgi:hypothetical protein